MQPARLDDDSPAARIYRYLSERPNEWVPNTDLVHAVPCIALSTHISAIRKRLVAEPERREVMEPARVFDGEHCYRLSFVTGQMELIA